MHKIEWQISCNNKENLKKATDIATIETAMDKDVIIEVKSFPNGILKTDTTHNIIEDYYSNIQLVTGKDYFRLVFHILPNADRFWKDVMVRILRSIQKSTNDVKIERVKK